MESPKHMVWSDCVAEQKRDEGMERAYRGAGSWPLLAFIALNEVAKKREFFTTDDVQRIFPDEPPEPRAWGPVMKRAAQKGLIEKTGRVRKSAKVSCHRREKAVWRSLVCVS